MEINLMYYAKPAGVACDLRICSTKGREENQDEMCAISGTLHLKSLKCHKEGKSRSR